jgi:hypothetical protein
MHDLYYGTPPEDGNLQLVLICNLYINSVCNLVMKGTYILSLDGQNLYFCPFSFIDSSH